MKMDPNIPDIITIEANYLVCNATEIFLRNLVKEAFQSQQPGKETLSYKALSNFIQADEKFEFLHGIAPKKITVKEYKKILQEEKENEKDVESGSDYESSDDDGEEEEEQSESESGSGEEESEDDEKENTAEKWISNY